MTNAEAIEHLKNIKIYSFQDGYTDEAREALDMAIKALEAQEQLANNSPELANNFGDLISRKAAIEVLMKFDKKLRKINWYQYPYIEHECRGVDKAIVKIANLPYAQPEHMHTVMLKIKEKYEKAMNTPCINNPIAWALYQTWKEYDR